MIGSQKSYVEKSIPEKISAAQSGTNGRRRSASCRQFFKAGEPHGTENARLPTPPHGGRSGAPGRPASAAPGLVLFHFQPRSSSEKPPERRLGWRARGAGAHTPLSAVRPREAPLEPAERLTLPVRGPRTAPGAEDTQGPPRPHTGGARLLPLPARPPSPRRCCSWNGTVARSGCGAPAMPGPHRPPH